MGCELFATTGNGSLNASINSSVLHSNLILSSSVEGDFLYQNLEGEISGALQAGISGSLIGDLTGSLEASINFPLNARFCWDDFVECGNGFSFNGGQVYPVTFTLQFGAGTGTVTVDFNALSIPDRFIIYYSGEVVVDTGFRGNSGYAYGGGARSTFNNAFTGLVDPISGLGYPNTGIPDTAADGFPNVTSPESGQATFEKNAYFITEATLEVYGPVGNTIWNIDASCPT